MGKFLKSLLQFFVFAILFYCIMIFVWGEFAPSLLRKNLSFKTTSTTRTKFTEVEEYSDLDILFLGSSHSYRGFDTRIFQKNGFKTFNLGTSGQTNVQTEYLLKKYLNKLNPKVVIFEVNPLIFAGDGVESTLDLLSSMKMDKELVALGISHHHINVVNSMIYSYFIETLLGRSKTSTNINFEENLYVKGGFVQKDMSCFKKGLVKTPAKYDINQNQLESFENILELLKKNNIKILLVQAPVTESFYNSIENSNHFDTVMKETGEKYVNYNGQIELVDSLHFYDNHHLNQEGVILFNDLLLKQLGNELHEWVQN